MKMVESARCQSDYADYAYDAAIWRHYCLPRVTHEMAMRLDYAYTPRQRILMRRLLLPLTVPLMPERMMPPLRRR